MKYVPVLALLAMVVVYTASNGQPKADLRNITKLQTKDAVTAYGPTTVTRAIKQDKKGNIWIASWEGIFRYDGQSFTNITRNVSSARFFSLLEDRKGNWWFGSIGSGVYRYDGQSFQEFTTKQGLLNNEVVCIYEDRKGNIWFGVNGGASRYDGHSFRNFRLNGDALTEDRTGQSLPDLRPPKFVNAILEDKTGKFWFGTREKAFVYDGKAFTILTNKGKPFTNVGTIIEDKKGAIWLNGNGLWRYDGSTFTNITQDPVLYVYEDKKGAIWTSSFKNSSEQNCVLSRYEAKSLYDKKPIVTEINSELGVLFVILEAYDGSIWLGADGVYRYNGNGFTNFKRKDSQK
ncbi:histidine kinase [Spirosoma sp. HMF3257]|uniref:Histidine kinase n=1 Tax=Spirosoma telluris TaxID=2183553 RepID=A0A327NIZ4_9BACT|nr:histidine kinase [Spirosoma telluris]RAI75152.1 histidine kinase [Spirosoma telluris]